MAKETEETLNQDTEEENVENEDTEAMVGGPGSPEDSIAHPPEKKGAPEKKEVTPKEKVVEAEEKVVEAEETTGKEEEVTPSPKFKFKDQAAAEVAHAEAMKKMHEATEESARYKKMLEGKPTEAKPTEPPAIKKVWQREKEEFETRRKDIPIPDVKDATAVEAYNNKVTDLYFEVHAKYTEIASDEKAAARKRSDDTWGWITTEAKKYGIDDTPFELKNEDGTVEQGNLSNVFLGVAQNPDVFGIKIRDASGNPLPLGDQVKAIATGINRFIDAIIVQRQALAKRTEKEKQDLTVLRRGSGGPKKGKEGEEEETVTTFAQGIEENKKNRRKAGSYRRS